MTHPQFFYRREPTHTSVQPSDGAYLPAIVSDIEHFQALNAYASKHRHEDVAIQARSHELAASKELYVATARDGIDSALQRARQARTENQLKLAVLDATVLVERLRLRVGDKAIPSEWQPLLTLAQQREASR